MLKEVVFDIWAPETALWSKWVKPVLFACMDSRPPSWQSDAAPIDLDWVPSATENVALVLDLPGAAGVEAGLALAAHCYRPVPLYNAIPMPYYLLDPGMVIPSEPLVKVESIMAALWHGRQRLQELALPPVAPPAFLLDRNRNGGGHQPIPGSFDNRSVSFTTDFPSATFLRAHGIRRAIVVQPTDDAPEPDMAHTLRRWQEGGMAIELKRLDVAGPATAVVVPRPSWFGWAWQRVLIAAGLSRNAVGGFGGWVPHPSGSGG